MFLDVFSFIFLFVSLTCHSVYPFLSLFVVLYLICLPVSAYLLSVFARISSISWRMFSSLTAPSWTFPQIQAQKHGSVETEGSSAAALGTPPASPTRARGKCLGRCIIIHSADQNILFLREYSVFILTTMGSNVQDKIKSIVYHPTQEQTNL